MGRTGWMNLPNPEMAKQGFRIFPYSRCQMAAFQFFAVRYLLSEGGGMLGLVCSELALSLLSFRQLGRVVMPDDVQDRILALKAEADGAYRAKDALKARDLYYQALDLGELPTIRSNLAAAEFELGQYESSIENSKRVIKFIDEAPDEPNLALRTKNVLRLCRSLTLLKKISEALEIASDLVLQLSSSGSDEQKNSASSVLESLNRATRYPAVSQTDAQTRLMPLSNLRPALNHNMEFYTVWSSSSADISSFPDHVCSQVGQDKPESLLGCPRVTQLTEEAIHDYIRLRLEIPRDAVAGDTNWDFDAMMIGAGDARHLYSSLIDIATQFSTGTNTLGSEMEDRPKDKGVGIHITVVSSPLDIKTSSSLDVRD